MCHRRKSCAQAFYHGKLRAFLALVSFLVFLPLASRAQWVTQDIRLVPGFNPVYLQVTPADPSPDVLFGGILQISEVWMYNRYLQTSTFTSNPGQPALGQDHWLTWFTKNGSKNFLSTLSQLRGGQSYLIKLASNAPPMTIHIKGMPAQPRNDWIPGDVVLAGFPVAETGGISFYQMLKDTPQVSAIPGSNSGLFSINPSTSFETQIRNPERTVILPGRAYWAYLSGHTASPYPFQVIAAGERNSVEFIQDKIVSSITLFNAVATTNQVLHLRLIDSEFAPTNQPARAGTVPIVALVPSADGSLTPRSLVDGLDVTLAAGQKLQLRLGLLVTQLNLTSNTNATYQALIEVTEKTHGYRQLVPVMAEVPGSKLFSRMGSLLARSGSVQLQAQADNPSSATALPVTQSEGLWVGTLTLNAVNIPGFAQSNNPSATQFPLVAATPLDTRVLLHVDSNGVSRLVQQVFFADVSDGTNRSTKMYRSLTNLPAGAILKSRVSAPSWPGAAPAAMTGYFGSNLTATLNIPFNDPLNPFVHKFHPDHNNLAEDFKTPLVGGQESFDISRNVRFYFGDTIQSGGSSYSPGVPALKFTGTNGEYVKTSAFTNTTSLSVQFWLNMATNRQNGATIMLLTNSNTQFKVAFVNNTGTLALTVGTNLSPVQIQATNALPVGVWANIAITYDGSYGTLYINGVVSGGGYLPALPSGAWSSLYVGNSAASGTPSFVGELHDLVVRNGALSYQNVPQLMVVPQLLDASSIILNLQGSAATTNVVNQGVTLVTITSSGSQLIDLSSSPSVPLWTYGTAQGAYQETITGLRKQAITVGGSFELTRVSQDPNLF